MMDFIAMYWKGIVLATIAAMVIGSIWYAKPVFGKKWQQLVGLKDKDMKSGAAKAMVIMLVMALVSAFVLQRFLVIASPHSYVEALKVAFWIWLGFVVTYSVGSGMFEKRPPMLIVLNIGNQLVTLLAMSAILYALM